MGIYERKLGFYLRFRDQAQRDNHFLLRFLGSGQRWRNMGPKQFSKHSVPNQLSGLKVHKIIVIIKGAHGISTTAQIH